MSGVNSQAEGRRRAMLRTAMGPAIAAALSDPRVIEIMVNPDGSLRLDLLGEGRVDTELRVEPAEAERIIRLVASHVRTEVHAGAPIVSAELPEGGERFEGLLPPIASAPCFSIRKPAARVHRLIDYVADGIMRAEVALALSMAVVERKNILVAGGTSSGKTTLANALLNEMATLDERVILIEDTRELQCAAADTVALRTRPGVVTMADLVRSTLRLRPDRIIVGEVRGGEALDMLKAWNTGQGNILHLRWDQVDMTRRIVTIGYGETKNGEALGVPLNEAALGVLRRQKGKHPVHVFTFRGKRLANANTRTWRAALKACGIEDFRWHDLRHTWATWLRQNDVPTWVLQELGGWKSESMVRRYAHMSVKHLQPYADQLILPGTDPLINPVTDTKKSNCPEKLESPGHKNGHSESRPWLKLVAGLDVNS